MKRSVVFMIAILLIAIAISEPVNAQLKAAPAEIALNRSKFYNKNIITNGYVQQIRQRHGSRPYYTFLLKDRESSQTINVLARGKASVKQNQLVNVQGVLIRERSFDDEDFNNYFWASKVVIPTN